MLIDNGNHSTTTAFHFMKKALDLLTTSNRHFAIGIGPTFILFSGKNHLNKTHLLSPQGISKPPCTQLNVRLTGTHHDQIKIIHCTHMQTHTGDTQLFFETMQKLLSIMVHDAKSTLFQMCTCYQSRNMHQQRFIDMPSIQQSIAKSYHWLELATPLNTPPLISNHMQCLANHWHALLKGTELLCQLHGAKSLIQNGPRDLYWMAWLCSQPFKTGSA
jgi:hypothetical protein